MHFTINNVLLKQALWSFAFLLLPISAGHSQNDVQTQQQDPAEFRAGPGDFRGGYEDADYRTRSVSLQARRGQEADLLTVLQAPPLGLPAVPVPDDNPLTGDKVRLGRKLFFDRRLSITLFCASGFVGIGCCDAEQED